VEEAKASGIGAEGDFIEHLTIHTLRDFRNSAT
jgi:hypothetical protein